MPPHKKMCSTTNGLIFTEFPELCHLSILRQMKVTDLLHVAPLVCRQWTKLQPEVLRARPTLTLIISRDQFFLPDVLRRVVRSLFDPPYELVNDDGTPMYTPSVAGTSKDLNMFQFRNLSTDRAKKIFDVFPRLTSLVIAMRHDQLDGLILLLKLYSPTLTTLFLDVQDTNYHNRQLIQLMDQLNQMEALKSLTLNVRSEIAQQQMIDLPILAQLEEFKFNSHDDAHLLVDSLERYAEPNKALKSITLWNNFTWMDQFSKRLSPELARKFTLVYLDKRCGNLFQFFAYYSCLTTVYLRDLGYGFRRILSLAPLTQLVKLYIRELRMEEPENHREFPTVSLPSLKLLVIKHVYGDRHEITNHEGFARIPLHTMCPSLQVVKIDSLQRFCKLCNIDLLDDISQEQWHRCTAPLVASIGKCEKLQFVYVRGSSRHSGTWTREQLLSIDLN